MFVHLYDVYCFIVAIAGYFYIVSMTVDVCYVCMYCMYKCMYVYMVFIVVIVGYFYIVTMVVVSSSLAVALIVVTCVRKRKNPSMWDKVRKPNLSQSTASILCYNSSNMHVSKLPTV